VDSGRDDKRNSEVMDKSDSKRNSDGANDRTSNRHSDRYGDRHAGSRRVATQRVGAWYRAVYKGIGH